MTDTATYWTDITGLTADQTAQLAADVCDGRTEPPTVHPHPHRRCPAAKPYTLALPLACRRLLTSTGPVVQSSSRLIY